MNVLNQCFVKETSCVTRGIVGETIIVPIKNRVGDLGSIYTVNEVGTMIWQLIDGRREVRQIADAVYETFDVEPTAAEKDTIEFLESLENAGLIHPATDDRHVGP